MVTWLSFCFKQDPNAGNTSSVITVVIKMNIIPLMLIISYKKVRNVTKLNSSSNRKLYLGIETNTEVYIETLNLKKKNVICLVNI